MKSIQAYLIFFSCFLHMAIMLASAGYSRGLPCPRITLKNGKIKTRPKGRFVKFVCNTGYMLAGERYATCVHGQWDSDLPKCVRPTCANKVSLPANGFMHTSHKGAVLHFLCNADFELRGPSNIYCDGRKWDNNAPICLRSKTKPKFFCDFEEEDICGWTPDLNHDFDWKREQYNTPSGHIGTGPSFDHTKGPGEDGYYMYIESSSRNENDTARLVSPVYEKTEADTCLEFFYHMYGKTTGTLRVYVKKVSEDWTLNPATAVFSKSGNQGDKWYRSYQSLGVIDEQYQIVIEGVRGASYVSDIAVDDVKIIENCVYEEEALSTTTEISLGTDYQYSVESCESRCGEKSLRNGSFVIYCDCDDDCVSNSTCCPDYLDMCALLTTTEEYYTTTDTPNEIDRVEKAATSKPVPRLTTTRTTSTPTTTKVTATTTRLSTTTTTTKKPTTTAVKLTTKSTMHSTKGIIIKPQLPPRKATIVILQPPTTPTIIRKVLPTAIPKSKLKDTKIIYVKPKLSNEIDNNDVSYVPKNINNDDTSEDKWSDELNNDIYSPLMRNFSESDKLLSQRVPDTDNYNVVLVVISVVGIIVLTTIIGIFIIKWYRGYRYTSRRMNSSNGDSQSDVRFLTGDEILNFSPDYDDL